MPFFRKPRADLLAQVRQDFNSAVTGVDAMLRRSFVGVLSYVHGMAMDQQYAYLDWISRQIHPTAADEEMLMRTARLWLPVPRRDATFANGNATATGVSGSVIPAGTVLRRADGALFSTTAEVTFSGTVVTVNLSAQVAGLAGNCAPSSILTLVSPVSGVQSVITVNSSGIVDGADIETLASVLARLQRRIQTPPQAGTGTDYVGWMFDASNNVTRAWAFPRENGPGTTTLRFAMDYAYADGIPLSGDVSLVASYIESKRPVTADITVVAPVPTPLNFIISGLAPNTTEIKAEITANLANIIRAEGTPGGDYWTGYTTTSGGTLLRSHLEEAIASTAGVNDFTLVTPSANVTAALGHLHTMGTISWT